MQKESGGALEERFLSLLIEIDPEISQRPEIAQGFAERLMAFTGHWANEPGGIQAHEAELAQWIEINAPDAVKSPALAFSHGGTQGSGE